jgi:dolichol-phosphate mannosyltransferase
MALVLIVIPTYNEADNLPTLLEAIHHAAPDAHILIADDGSPDGTADIAEGILNAFPGSRVLRRTQERGYGRACLDGFRYALEHDYDFVLTMDADWSHDPVAIPKILEALEAGNDLVIGSRYCNGISVVNWPLRRVLLSIFANNYVRAILRLPVQDCTSGYRGYRARALRAANLSGVVSEGYAFLVEMAVRIHRAGAQLVEVPILFVERRAGQSKMSKRVMFESALLPWRLLITPLRLDKAALSAENRPRPASPDSASETPSPPTAS